MDGGRTMRAVPVGIGLRAPHVTGIVAARPALSFLEVHSENYIDMGPALHGLMEVRRDYPVSLHGVGLSLGSAAGIDLHHLARLRALADRIEPMLVSEHLAWSIVGGAYLNDLLPLPYTEESLGIVARNVERMQEALGRRVLVENPSLYLRFRHSTIDEPAFLAELARRTGCGILCDVNNIFVSAQNIGGDPARYLADLPADAVGEIHLAGHARRAAGDRELLIDDHGAPVCEAVWSLHRSALALFGPVPSLIERDRNLPELAALLAEAERARCVDACAA